MYKFESSLDKRTLHRAYNALYVHDLDRKWNKNVLSHPLLAGAMLPGMSAKKLLTAEFKKLVEVYFHYKEYVAGLTDIQAKEVRDAANKVFSYESFTKKISAFLINPAHKFEIWNCVYCDMIKVSPFNHKGKLVRRFDTEHVLDKGDCPLVALSLYNFVPSCGTCNDPAIKGTRTIGDTKEEISKLSPTNPSYDFWHNVLFVVNAKADMTCQKREDVPDNFEIDFSYKDVSYKKSVELFALKSRYNTDCLMEALRWLDKKDIFSPRLLQDIAKLEGCSEAEVFERVFKIDIDRREHNLYRKMKEDLLEITPWEQNEYYTCKMRKDIRVLVYVVACLVVLLLPNIVSFIQIGWKWLDGYVVKENFLASVTLACIAIFVEFFYIHRHVFESQAKEKYAMAVSPFYFDSPTSSDLFNRKNYAKLLLDKIYSSFSNQKRNNHSFVIHIGEHYGQGKTSFLMMLDEEIKKRKVPVINIHFEPWLCDTEMGIVNEFFDSFRIEVGEYLPRLNSPMRQYLKLLLATFKYEANGFSLSFDPFLKEKSTLKTTHDQIRDELMVIDRPVIITIDDVDRLQDKELMMVLKIIRDTADFPNVFYIVAADILHLKRMLNSLNIDNAEEYLKKFFNLEFQLPANENVAFEELLKLLDRKYQELEIDEKTRALYVSQIRNVVYIRDAFSNMREVYRFVNSYFLAIDSMQDIRQLNLFDLFLLTMVQTLNMEYYLQLRDHSLNLLDVVRSGNDILLQWKGDLNIIQKREEKEALRQVESIRVNDINPPYEERRSEKVEIPEFAETVVKTMITSNDIIPELMNLMFGQGSQNVASNRICRHNMFFKYFSNTDASYMVPRIEVVDMLNSEEKIYYNKLVDIFKTKRDELFLSEFTYAIPYVKKHKETYILKRFFIFMELSYKYGRNLPNYSMIRSLAGYEGWETSRQKLFNVLACIYERYSQARLKAKQDDFTQLCMTYSNINILLVCLNVMSNQIGYFMFDRKYIDDTNIMLVDRFFKEKVAKSKGKLGIQEIDTIQHIQCDYDMREHWNKCFEKFLKDDKDTCLNLLCRLVIFYGNGNIEWDYHYKNAILGGMSMHGDNLLTHLIEVFPKEKDIFNSLLSLYTHCSSLIDVSNLNDDAFIKMARLRQQSVC